MISRRNEDSCVVVLLWNIVKLLYEITSSFFEKEAGMKTKTVVTDIPFNFCSTDVACCSTSGRDIMRCRYSISRIITGTNRFKNNLV